MAKPNERIAIMWDVYNSLDWNLFDYLRQADSIIRVMMSDMKMHGVPKKQVKEFMKERLMELLEYVHDQVKRDGVYKSPEQILFLSIGDGCRENVQQESVMQNVS